MLGDNLKKFREQKGITQEDASVNLNIVRQTLSKWEKGLSAPDANMLEKIAALYDVSVNELLGILDTHDEDLQEEIAKELAKLNEQIALRNKRQRVLWIAVMVIGIIVLVWGCVGAAVGIVNYNALLGDMTFSEELVALRKKG